jgi:hypothetical protein
MRRRVIFTVIVAILALMMALAGGPAALAATKRLPIRSGPHGLSRAPGAITPKIVGGTPSPTGSTSSRRPCSPSPSATTTSSASTAAAA